ncbi:hypothetical protein [Burkholderia glumae]|uniref:hypothetical protein n=1 Tax=Burkholderia glumae TaxID=337 RepID=UPI002036B7DB|nr:hypothetical protein [Burkholderia glumae]MCM2547248.1 hypothetical protein [Burkholderia glumae]
MGINNMGYACCKFCDAEFRLFTISNRDMQALCKVWKRRHERVCAKKSPAQRRAWARPYIGKDSGERSLTVDLSHAGFNE